MQKTIVGSATTVYVYDAFGQLAAEYSTAAAVTPPCTTCYLTYDHLGSVRMVTDQNGTVVSRHDYLPFGEEIPGGQAGRTSQWGASDSVGQKFTGQIRDQETGVDYFNARYFGAALGRFTSPDPMNAGADLMNPQSWNGYSYVRDNPLENTDSTGLWCEERCGGATTGGGGYDPFQLMNIPVTMTSFFPGVAPDPLKLEFPSGATSATITFGTPPPSWQTVQVGTVGDYDVPVGIDIWKGQQKLWSNTASVGNALGVATAAVSALPAVVPVASSAIASGLGTAQAARGLFGAGVVLGHDPEYRNAAAAIGANALNFGKNTWNFLSYLGETWTANRAFLNTSIITGQQFWLSTVPELARYGSYYASELQYLQSRGINPATLPIVLPQLIP